MKQQLISTRSMARPAAFLMAALVLGLTYANIARAAVTIQVPNHSETVFGVPAAGVTGNIGLPIFNSPITISGTTTTVGFRGTGFVHLTYASAAPALWDWAGVHASGTAKTTAQGFTGGFGIDIVDVGFAGNIELQTGGVGGTVRLHSNGPAATVPLQMIW